MREHLLARTYGLAERLSGLGVCGDLAGLPMADLWGVYCFLMRLSGEATYGSEP